MTGKCRMGLSYILIWCTDSSYYWLRETVNVTVSEVSARTIVRQRRWRTDSIMKCMSIANGVCELKLTGISHPGTYVYQEINLAGCFWFRIDDLIGCIGSTCIILRPSISMRGRRHLELQDMLNLRRRFLQKNAKGISVTQDHQVPSTLIQ